MGFNTNALNAFASPLRAIPPWRESVAISLHKPRNEIFNSFVLVEGLLTPKAQEILKDPKKNQ